MMMVGQMTARSRCAWRSRLSRSNCSLMAGGKGLRLAISLSTVDNLTASEIMDQRSRPGNVSSRIEKTFRELAQLGIILIIFLRVYRRRRLLTALEDDVAVARPFHAISKPYVFRFTGGEIVSPAHHAAFVGNLLFRSEERRVG